MYHPSSPLVTVILPVYNAEKYLYESVFSVLNQSYKNFELLIFNDCSTDNSRNILHEFSDDRIRIIDSTVNTGYVKHLNTGLEIAKGKYIARMDADDICDPARFEKQVLFLENNPTVAACGSFIKLIGVKQGILKFPVLNDDILTHLLLFGNAMAHPSVMMRRSLLISNNIIYDRSLEPAEDYDMWVKLSVVGKLYNIPEVLLKYRIHDTNESVIKKQKQDQAVQEIRKKMVIHLQGGRDSISVDNVELLLDFLSGIPAYDNIDSSRFTIIKKFCKNILSTGLYNNLSVKKAISYRWTTFSRGKNISGLRRALYYLELPKENFSLKLFLTLLFKDDSDVKQ